MNRFFTCIYSAALAGSALCFALGLRAGTIPPHPSPLDERVSQFDVTDAILRDGISELSLQNINLHLGFEEVTRAKIQDDPRAVNPHFSLHLRNATVREILDAICASDARYTWLGDGDTINIYPKNSAAETNYLFNLSISEIALSRVPDPDQALTPLAALFPEQQIGYAGAGGSNGYPRPWTVALKNLTVRQFINRIAEHMGPHTTWAWQGGQGERLFTFVNGGLHTFRPADK